MGGRPKWLAIVAAVAAVAVIAQGAGARPSAATSVNRDFYNPIRANSPDPSLVVWNKTYYLAPTTGSNITIYWAPTLSGLATTPNAYTWTPPSNTNHCCDLWAPTLQRPRSSTR